MERDFYWPGFPEWYYSRKCSKSSTINTYKDDDGNYVYEVEIPGFKKEDITINVKGDILTINGRVTRGNGLVVELDKTLNIRGLKCKDAKMENGVLSLVFEENEKKDTILIR